MKCIVFYENWQMECCGTAFSVGDTVKLTVTIKTAVNLSSQFYRYFLPGIYTACMFRSNAARAIKEKLEMMKGKAENCDINLGNYFLFTIEHTFVKL